MSLEDAARWAGILGPFLAVAALVWSVRTFRKELRFGHYTELDRLYLDIVALRITAKIGVPVDGKFEKGTDEHHYALVVWNFIEAIHDRCNADEQLMETWLPVIKAEGAVYASWLAENPSYFKESFRKWAGKTIPATIPVQQPS
jgi:hypothetical protein